MNTRQILTGGQVRALLDARHHGWKRDRQGWVTLELDGVLWRVHYHRGALIEVDWWEGSGLSQGVRRPTEHVG